MQHEFRVRIDGRSARPPFSGLVNLLTILSLFSPSLVWASLNISLPPALTNMTPPAQWNLVAGQSSSAILTSCGAQQIQSTLNGAMAVTGLNPFGGMNPSMGRKCPQMFTNISTPCMGSDVFNFDPSSLSCSVIRAGGKHQMPGGQVMTDGEIKLQQEEQQAEAAMCTVQCEKNKAIQIQTQATCLKNAFLQMEQQAGSLAQQFQTFIQQAQLDVQAFKNAEQDDAQKISYIQTKLGPIQSLQQSVTQLVNTQMPQDLLNIQNLNTNIKNAQTTNAQVAQAQVMAQTMNCFKTRPVSTFTCVPNGPPVSAYDALICRFRQNASHLGANNTYEQSSLLQTQGQGQTASLTTTLTNMFNDAPNTTNLPKTPDEFGAFLSQNFRILSPSDLATYYQGAFSGFAIGGESAWSIVQTEISNCYAIAQQEMAATQNEVGSLMGQAQQAVAAQQRTMTATAAANINSYSSAIQAAGSALGGVTIPYDTSACINSSGDALVTCVQNLQNQARQILGGNGVFNLPPLVIKGNNPATYQTQSCYSLSQCSNDLQQDTLFLQSDQQATATQRTNFIKQTDQALTQYAQKFGQLLGVDNALLQTNLQALNGALGSLRAQGITLQPGQTQPFDQDQDGLIQSCQNMMACLNNYVPPPGLPDLNSDAFSQALQSLGQEELNMNQRLARIQNDEMQIKTAEARCNAEYAQQAIEGVVTQMSSAQDCQQEEMCKSQTKYNDLMDVITRIGNNSAAPMGTFATLQSSLITACPDVAMGEMPWDNPGLADDQKELLRSNYIARNRRGCRAFEASLLSADKILGGAGGGFWRTGGAGSVRGR